MPEPNKVRAIMRAKKASGIQLWWHGHRPSELLNESVHREAVSRERIVIAAPQNCPGSDRGAGRAAFMAMLITTAKLNDIDSQVWLIDVLACLADTPVTKLAALLPWYGKPETAIIASAA